MRPTRIEPSSRRGTLGAPPDGPLHDPRAGFVLSLVVFLLFAIGIAGAASYQVVLNESLLSVHANETQRALAIARAGLQRYISVQVGVHKNTVTYAIEGGDAVVTARLVAVDDFESLYLLSSEGVYTDPTFTGSAARRTIHQWARKREVAFDHLAAVTQASGWVFVNGDAELYGDDQGGVCEQSSRDIIGVLMGSGDLSYGGSSVDGNPDSTRYGSYSAVLDSLGLDWSLLTSPSFPVDYENTWPSCALPSDSFTVTRFTGDLDAPGSACGRGVLIVVGELTPLENFTWDGVVLAGRMTPSDEEDFAINGQVVGGLNGLGGATVYYEDQRIKYDRCMAFKAGKRLSHFQLVGSTWWESL